MNDSACDKLAETLRRYAVELPAGAIAPLDAYRRLLWQWNEKLNLTRHTDYETFVTRDVVDSLQLAALLADGEKVLDLGTGGGVPGVILAIVRPELNVSLAESVAKRAKAVEAIVGDLGLPVHVHCRRAEDILEQSGFDAVVARAVAPLPKVLKWLAPCWPRIGRLLLVKSSRWIEERKEARHRGLLRELELRRAAVYVTPGTDAENVILKLWRKQTASA